MCADKVVRFIKKCLRGEESSATTTSSDTLPSCPMDCPVHGSVSAGSSPAQGHRRHRTQTERSRRGLPDILQSQNICSITASSFAKEKYGPLLDIGPHDNFQSQPNIYSDTKGVRDQDLCHQLPYRPLPRPPPHLCEQLRTNLQHLPYHHHQQQQQQQKTSSGVAASPANSQQFSQKHLHHLFPPSVHRSMDGEERCWTKCGTSVLSRGVGPSGPPPNRTIFS